eukprot:CAMPEP_0194363290 /NCGR_PEP_ID=MMETSP0174-20130528/11120_1 /TAXON_ID=216777 /ORGANISM="Proboscia alata, Strain PI-D3" /LENGTH=307 /DNA_ID=CAMNT_0039136643 /DNA_START=301 /DNA_END=1224 /DNA_ORIENTATION=-
MASIRGTLPLMKGSRTENEKLRLGVFTQDLAQELDPTCRALDLVTTHARGGEFGDFTITNNDARGVMGMLGLGGDKPLRLIGDLSGGEKARVALSMFALKASNVLMLDEPSNHLDVECIEGLSDALSNWGGKDGAVMVISHDRSFCESVGFTHIGTVKDGMIKVEERGLRSSDWDLYDMNANAGYENDGMYAINNGDAAGHTNGGTSATAVKENKPAIPLTAEEKKELSKRRKIALNAPKRISKLENMITKCEERIANLDDEMMANGSNAEKLMELTDLKQKEDDNIANHMEEWEDLEFAMEEFNIS